MLPRKARKTLTMVNSITLLMAGAESLDSYKLYFKHRTSSSTASACALPLYTVSVSTVQSHVSNISLPSVSPPSLWRTHRRVAPPQAWVREAEKEMKKMERSSASGPRPALEPLHYYHIRNFFLSVAIRALLFAVSGALHLVGIPPSIPNLCTKSMKGG